MGHGLDHAANRWCVLALHYLIEPGKAQPLDHQLVLLWGGNLGPVVLQANHRLRLLRSRCHQYSSCTCLPRAAATSPRSRNCTRASKVALTTLCGLAEPRLLVRMFCTPTEVMTARTAPPAMTPVPSGAGFNSTWPDPKRPNTWWGI